ncbi:hypothetical protein GCM10010885_24650 [Alicyclobacillus cellulosilyticus]|uniref:Uncharacterized protein n=1 Tax=Alicyclobacillus cellulosilyticus TaxID=1003997 RepID=A0A917KJP1_9BACL|nr:hypothetical protein [Alicyclobacillus cellulosilyticus]GGJ14454.1 hypothetical protein GCM10010885_24650 [Alicyclobacillus cellulosilyticus]
MAEKNRQYSIRLRNGEQEIEVHHDPEFISNVWSQLFQGVSNIFSTKPIQEQSQGKLLSVGTEKAVASLPENSHQDIKREEVIGAEREENALPKNFVKHKRKFTRIKKVEQEEIQKLIAARFEEDQVYQQLVDTYTDVETRALIVLYIADQYSKIKGLSAVQAANILKERFKQSVNRSTIQMTLDRKSIPSKLVIKEESKYRIMKPGIEKVKELLNAFHGDAENKIGQ